MTHPPCALGRVPTPETSRSCSPFEGGVKLSNPLKQACFVLAVLIAAPGVASGLQAREPLQDWDQVHQLRPGSRVVVKPFKGMGRKTAGSYASSDEGGIVLHSPTGRTQAAIPRESIRAVVWKRRMRWAPAKGAAIGFGAGAALALLGNDFVQPLTMFVFGGVSAAIGVAVGGLVRVVDGPVRIYEASKPAPPGPRRSGGNRLLPLRARTRESSGKHLQAIRFEHRVRSLPSEAEEQLDRREMRAGGWEGAERACSSPHGLIRKDRGSPAP